MPETQTADGGLAAAGNGVQWQIAPRLRVTPSPMTTVFTIGHSNHPPERFIELLRRNRIAAVADVRSKPFSRRHPHFSQPALTETLRAAGVEYLFFGEPLGGQPA